MQQIEVNVESDHIERITTAKPLAAISELIWNAYDADAHEVIIELEEGQVTKPGLIRVIDDGAGIPIDKVEVFFQSLGGSWKKRTFKTNGGRTIHGEKGQGRFKAFALGERVTWISRHGGKEFSISGEKSDLKSFSISDTVPSAYTGCTVEIENIVKDFEIWTAYGFAEQVRNVFALQLYEGRNFRIVYDGDDINARDAIRDVTPYEITALTPPYSSKTAGKVACA